MIDQGEEGTGECLEMEQETLQPLEMEQVPEADEGEKDEGMRLRQNSKYAAIDLTYPGLRQLHDNPPVYIIDHFLDPELCESLISQVDATDCLVRSPVVGKNDGVVSKDRTSSTCFLQREDTPTVMDSISRLLNGVPHKQIELPQIGRYFPTQQYRAHFDAFNMSDANSRRFAENGGQRICTVLIYLNDVPHGGCTEFPRLDLRVQPVKGSALVFFPTTMDGEMDELALHAGCPAITTKWVCQVWVRQYAFVASSNVKLVTRI